MQIPTVRLIVGLGNPGIEYVGTRHNVGFELIDLFTSEIKKKELTMRCRSEVNKTRYASKTLFLQKPLTFMNLSGEAVKGLCRQEKISADEILVVYDCLDLPVGQMRLRAGGSSGGQRGMESIINHFGTDKIKRLRIGIGSENKRDAADFVLSRFTEEERLIMDKTIKVASDAVKTVVRFGLEKGMSRFNGTCITSQEGSAEEKTGELKEE